MASEILKRVLGEDANEELRELEIARKIREHALALYADSLRLHSDKKPPAHDPHQFHVVKIVDLSYKLERMHKDQDLPPEA